MRIVIATTNSGKLKEFKELAEDVRGIEFVLAPPEFEVEETGITFEENAILKAEAAAKMTGLIAFSDDSGIEVDALDGRPGIYSARYCEGNDADRRKKMLNELEGVPEGKRRGQVATSERGENGFGFDPIFFLSEHNATAAEISPVEKHRISHRGQAFKQVLTFLQSELLKTV
jgi:XTP/dITP diphosphohydrolase